MTHIRDVLRRVLPAALRRASCARFGHRGPVLAVMWYDGKTPPVNVQGFVCRWCDGSVTTAEMRLLGGFHSRRFGGVHLLPIAPASMDVLTVCPQCGDRLTVRYETRGADLGVLVPWFVCRRHGAYTVAALERRGDVYALEPEATTT